MSIKLMRIILSGLIISVLSISPGRANEGEGSECFPPMVRAGVTLVGENVTFEIVDVHACWIKARVCSRGDCRPNYHWVHATRMETFRGGLIP